ncbi:MAG TPA: hypothetical protein VI749_06340 [Candidatus Omnitrophota bacterium]|nr:hypothetical protein [Candidatus Omnitrophota bacterium]
MIKIDLILAVAIYCSLSILLVFVLWVFYNYNKEKLIGNDSLHLEQCNFCTHIFFNYLDKEIVICPLCKSYVHTEGAAAKKNHTKEGRG